MEDTGKYRTGNSESGEGGEAGKSNHSNTTNSSGGDGAGGGEAGERKEKRLSRLAGVNSDEQANVLHIAPVPKKEKKKRVVKEQSESSANFQQNFQLFLAAVNEVIGTRAPMWKASPEEIRAISEPASRIVEKLLPADKVNENTDYVLLAVAVGGYALPRILVAHQNKQSRGNTKNGQGEAVGSGRNGQPAGEPTGLSQKLPAIVPT